MLSGPKFKAYPIILVWIVQHLFSKLRVRYTHHMQGSAQEFGEVVKNDGAKPPPPPPSGSGYGWENIKVIFFSTSSQL